MMDAFEQFYVDLHAPGGQAAIVDRLAGRGLVTFDRIFGRNGALTLMRSFATVLQHRDSDPGGVTVLTASEPLARVRSGFAGFTSQELKPHTDGSSLPRPPTLVMLVCAVPAGEGGTTEAIDGAGSLRLAGGRSARSVAGVADAAIGAVREGCGSSRVGIRAGRRRWRVHPFRHDDLARFSPAVTAVLPQFLEVIRTRTVRFMLGPGQGYVLQNGRWLHGRTGFSGRRRMHRILGEPYPAARLGGSVGFGFMPNPTHALPATKASA